MSEHQVAVCRSCGAPIRWAKTRKGKNIPLDDEPGTGGSFVLQDADGPKPLALKMKKEEAETRADLFTCHFETCPDAASFRKKGK